MMTTCRSRGLSRSDGEMGSKDMGLTPERWEYLKNLKPKQRLFWDSTRKGTYVVGRNKEKRAPAQRDTLRKGVIL